GAGEVTLVDDGTTLDNQEPLRGSASEEIIKRVRLSLELVGDIELVRSARQLRDRPSARDNAVRVHLIHRPKRDRARTHRAPQHADESGLVSRAAAHCGGSDQGNDQNKAFHLVPSASVPCLASPVIKSRQRNWLGQAEMEFLGSAQSDTFATRQEKIGKQKSKRRREGYVRSHPAKGEGPQREQAFLHGRSGSAGVLGPVRR